PIIAFLSMLVVSFQANAGTVFYVAIPAADSDANSGINTKNVYTSAVDGGNTKGTDRVVNGVTLAALIGATNTCTANNMTLSVATGALINGGGKSETIQADGVLLDVFSSMTFNDGAENGSEQYVVLDTD